MFTAIQINSAIMRGEWSNEEINSFVESIKFARGVLGQKNKNTLTIGQKVKWNSTSHGIAKEGIIEKINKKNVYVRVGLQSLWSVPANMLEIL